MSQIIKELNSFARENLIYPEPKSESKRFIYVPLVFEIDSKLRPINIRYKRNSRFKRRTIYTNQKRKLTWNKEYINNAKQVINKFQGWNTSPIYENIESTKQEIGIYFSYHTHYFQTNTIQLNPESKPIFENRNRLYELLIEGKHPCEGIANILCIVEKDGTLTNFEYLGAEGKTSCYVAQMNLMKLGKWKPATHENKNVRAQIELMVFCP